MIPQCLPTQEGTPSAWHGESFFHQHFVPFSPATPVCLSHVTPPPGHLTVPQYFIVRHVGEKTYIFLLIENRASCLLTFHKRQDPFSSPCQSYTGVQVSFLNVPLSSKLWGPQEISALEMGHHQYFILYITISYNCIQLYAKTKGN